MCQHSSNRKSIVAFAGQPLPESLNEAPSSNLVTTAKKVKDEATTRYRSVWAMQLASVYEIMPLICPKCGGDMKIIALINDSGSINKILLHLDLPTEVPKLSPARGPPMEYDQVEMDIEETFDELPDDNIDQSMSW